MMSLVEISSAASAPEAAGQIEWLMQGDPAIRWQTLRDLLGAPPAEWRAERERTLAEGWGARLLALQEPGGGWGGGVYSPKWISTTYTLLTLRDIGVPPSCAAAQRGAHLALARMLGERRDSAFDRRLAGCDRCIVGMLLGIAVYFEVDDARVDAMAANLLAELMPDGAWNCRRHRKPHPHHSSFHTTLNVLEGLREYVETRDTPLREAARSAEQGAIELLLQHRLFRSDKTGEIIREQFTQPVYPCRWHYDILRGLAHLARAAAPRDPRAQEAVELLLARRRGDGHWPAGKQYGGREFFRMETGGPSRWNTLRALRVLRWWKS